MKLWIITINFEESIDIAKKMYLISNHCTLKNFTYALPILGILLLCDFRLLDLLHFFQLILGGLVEVAWLNLDELQWIVGGLWGRHFGYPLLLYIFRGIKRCHLEEDEISLNSAHVSNKLIAEN